MKKNLYNLSILMLSIFILATMFLRVTGNNDSDPITGLYVAFGHTLSSNFLGSSKILLNPYILLAYFLPLILSLILLYLVNTNNRRWVPRVKIVLAFVFIFATIAFLTINYTTRMEISLLGQTGSKTIYELAKSANSEPKLGIGSILGAILSGLGLLVVSYDIATKS